MTGGVDAWTVVQIAELVRASEELLLRTLRVLDADACARMPESASWILSASDTEELRTILFEHGDVSERLRALTESLPATGVVATYDDVRAGAATALADGPLDPAAVTMAAAALDVRTGWTALSDALVSTDVRTAWSGLRVRVVLGSFRRADPRLVGQLLHEVGVEPDALWSDLTPDATQRIAAGLRSYGARS